MPPTPQQFHVAEPPKFWIWGIHAAKKPAGQDVLLYRLMTRSQLDIGADLAFRRRVLVNPRLTHRNIGLNLQNAHWTTGERQRGCVFWGHSSLSIASRLKLFMGAQLKHQPTRRSTVSDIQQLTFGGPKEKRTKIQVLLAYCNRFTVLDAFPGQKTKGVFGIWTTSSITSLAAFQTLGSLGPQKCLD